MVLSCLVMVAGAPSLLGTDRADSDRAAGDAIVVFGRSDEQTAAGRAAII
jgi:hypothetical protein